ncbi:hypothetical protein [Terrabacter sp. NPDC080008]|uniref:hypothetical protein n=1 Tax=Terrabacter sp. NPDC080008 TaxID=3155176 RepID=UPI00344F3DA6
MSDVDPNLKDVLGDRAARVRVVSNLAERAIERDRSNRRRELGVGALAAGLVLAVAVPVGWAAIGSEGGRALPAGPTVSTSVPTPVRTGVAPTDPNSTNPTATTRPTPTSIPTLTPDGSAPVRPFRPATGGVTGTTAVPYVVDGVIHDGPRTVKVPAKFQTGQLARVAGGRWLVTGTVTLVSYLLDASGTSMKRLDGTPKVSSDGTVIVVGDDRGGLAAYDAEGRQIATLGAKACQCAGTGAQYSPGLVPVGIVGSTVYAQRGSLGSSLSWDVGTGKTQRIAGHITAVDAAQRTAVIAPDPNTAPKDYCNELRDLDTGLTRWRLCAPILIRSFSSDGSYLLGTGTIDGIDPSQLSADGKRFRYGTLVVVRTSDAALVLQGGTDPSGKGSPSTYRLGGDSALTAQVAVTPSQRNLQRCTLDGVCEVVAPARPRNTDIPDADEPYVLSSN